MVQGTPNVIGFDDGPFPKRDEEADFVSVPLVGAVYARDRLDGLLTGTCTRDGDDATSSIATIVRHSRFDEHVRAVMIQGVTVGGFNVVDIHALSSQLERPVIVVVRKVPNYERIERALESVPNGEGKWATIRSAGDPVPVGNVFMQFAGCTLEQAASTVHLHTTHGAFPEPLRIAHLVAAAFVTGHSHGAA